MLRLLDRSISLGFVVVVSVFAYASIRDGDALMAFVAGGTLSLCVCEWTIRFVRWRDRRRLRQNYERAAADGDQRLTLLDDR